MSVRPVVAALAFFLARPLAAQSDAAFVAWARDRAVPLDASGRAFRSLDKGIEHARLIGVGESVHESEPFLSFRLQLLQDLVRRHRVTALVLESGLPEAMAADDYVRGRTQTIDYDTALPGGYGNLEPIRATIEWLREWNLGAGRKHPVGVYGADLPARSGSMVPALDRLQELTADHADIKPLIDAVRKTAAPIGAGWWKGAAQKYDPLPADVKAALHSDVQRLNDHVSRLTGGDTGSDKDHLAWARRLAIVIQQSETTLRLGAFAPTAPRDIAMADNTLWVLSWLAPGERAVYWAHNAHIQRVPVQGPPLPPGQYPSAGMHFHDALRGQYYAIATTYGGPSVENGPGNAQSAKPGSVDATLEAVAKSPFLLSLHPSLHPARRPAVVNTWLAEERPMRFQVDHLLVTLGKAFDAVAYFDHATRVK